MTSTIKVNKHQNACGTNIIQRCGTTTTIGSGASNTLVMDGSAVTIGRCGGTVALASGATQTGFGRTGTVDWQTGSVKTATFTAVSGEGYFANTTGSAFNMNLPAGVAGAIVSVADYAETFDSNKLTIVPNGTDKIGSLNENAILETKGQSVTLVYVDSTQGWINTMDSTSNVRGAPPFIVATGGTITTSGNDKIHTFTGPGTFTVSCVAVCAANNQVSYMVVAGGGGGGSGTDNSGGGGGAGGFREDKSPITPYTASPLEGAGPITVTATGFPITVGGGGSAGGFPSGQATAGSNSVFSTITSAGGGFGGNQTTGQRAGGSGGSGGGGGGGLYGNGTGGSGNTPPTSPAQGQNGGTNAPGGPAADASAGGGGGATDTGTSVSPSNAGGGQGGDGATTGINGSNTAFAGGGGGGTYAPQNPTIAPGGTGGGGNGGRTGTEATAGTTNTGGGGGGNSSPGGVGTAGGSGIVIIRYKFQ